MKKQLSFLLVLVMICGLFAGCQNDSPTAGDQSSSGGSPSGGTTYINIGTGGTAGTYYPLGGAFAEIWNNNLKDFGVNATVESTGASAANVNLMRENKIEISIIQNDIAAYAVNGELMFEETGKYDDLRGMACLYNEPLQLVTVNPDIKSVADLKGKKVAIGAIGSGVEANAKQILAAAGLDVEKDIMANYLSFAEASTAMKDLQIDAAFLVAGVPTAAIVDLATQRDVYVVPIDGDLAKKLMNDYSFFAEFTYPADTYKGVTGNEKSLTVKSMLAVSANVSEDIVYNMLKSMYENGDRISNAHAVGKDIVKEKGLEGMSIQLHPGAEKYFKEVGVLK